MHLRCPRDDLTAIAVREGVFGFFLKIWSSEKLDYLRVQIPLEATAFLLTVCSGIYIFIYLYICNHDLPLVYSCIIYIYMMKRTSVDWTYIYIYIYNHDEFSPVCIFMYLCIATCLFTANIHMYIKRVLFCGGIFAQLGESSASHRITQVSTCRTYILTTC